MVRRFNHALTAVNHGKRALRHIAAAKTATEISRMTYSPVVPVANVAIWESHAETWARAAKIEARAAFRAAARALQAREARAAERKGRV